MGTSFTSTYIIALVITFGLLGIFAWIVKRFGQSWITHSPTRRMRIIEKTTLAPNTHAYLIQIDNDTLFAITTPQSSLVHNCSPPAANKQLTSKKRKALRT